MLEMMMVIVFLLGYALITLEHKIGVNKTAIALLMAVGCWVLVVFQHGGVASGGVVLQRWGENLREVAEIVFFLIGAMTIVQLMETHGGFNLVTRAIITRDKKVLLWVVSLITFFLSAVLDNLTTAIVMSTLMFRLIEHKEDRLIFISMIVIAANAGGAWTPIGDVTTTMLWIGGRISSGRIMQMLLIPSLVAMLVPLVYFTFVLQPGEAVRNEKPGDVLPGARRVFWMGLAALIFVPVFKAFTGLPPVAGMLFGLAVLWVMVDILHGHARVELRGPAALSRIDFSSVLFFLGILLAVAALDAGGLLSRFAGWIDLHWDNKDGIVTLLGLLSAFVGNVPLTAATMRMYDVGIYPMDSKLWELLAYAAGTGGSVLIIGSAAGVMAMGIAGINFFWYLRRVAWIALIGYLAGIAAYLFIYQMGQ